MNKNLKAILALFIGFAGAHAKAEYLELSHVKVQELTAKHGVDFLNELSDRGILITGSDQSGLYLRANEARKLLKELQRNGNQSGIELVKELTDGSTMISRKKFEGMSLGTQDVISK
jgi:hypothetical protein